jgi:hypothetical protein
MHANTFVKMFRSKFDRFQPTASSTVWPPNLYAHWLSLFGGPEGGRLRLEKAAF